VSTTQEARATALEDAAAECDAVAAEAYAAGTEIAAEGLPGSVGCSHEYEAATECARRIRALKSAPSRTRAAGRKEGVAAVLAALREDADLATLRAEVERLTRERDGSRERAERLEVQLAGCGVAALGWSKSESVCKPGDYGWSASYGDVVTLRERMTKAEAEVEAMRAWHEQCAETWRQAVGEAAARADKAEEDRAHESVNAARAEAEVTRLRAIESAADQLQDVFALTHEMAIALKMTGEQWRRLQALRAALAPPLVRPKNRSGIVIGGEGPGERKGDG
jgi:hypothetical protein